MGIRQDTEDSLKDFTFTPIEGQPTDEDINNLVEECSNAAASVPTSNGGGRHGHIGMLMEDADYQLISHGNAAFTVPVYPGAYPATVDENNAAVRERQIAEHKVLVIEFETYQGVESFLRKKIVASVEPAWLAALRSTTMGFNLSTPKQLIDHLRSVGGDLEASDVRDRIEKQLERAGHAKNPELRLAFAETTFEASAEFEPAMREWELKTSTTKTFSNFRVFIQNEFAKRHKRNKSTAKSVGHGIANAAINKQADDPIAHVEATALAIAEVAHIMQESQEKQFTKMLELFKSMADKQQANAPHAPTAPPAATPAGQTKKKRCPNCNLMVLHKPENCWELEANASKRPTGWTSKKSS
ncbi:hypothetical protein ACHAW6_005933 [Cyclotella cf. meneghiniana]